MSESLDTLIQRLNQLGRENRLAGRLSMSFYVYENWQAGPHKTVIHPGSCGFCNDGRGRAGGYDPAHAKWHPGGPSRFETLQEAHDFADSLPGVVERHEHSCV